MGRVGYVYLIRQGDSYKIGKSRQPQVRLRHVAPLGGVILHLIPSENPFQIENALHRRFAAKRIAGRGREWFSLDQEDVDLICQVGPIRSADDLSAALQSTLQTKGFYLEFPPELIREVEKLAEKTGRSRTHEIVRALQRHLLYPEPMVPMGPLDQDRFPPPPEPAPKPRRKPKKGGTS